MKQNLSLVGSLVLICTSIVSCNSGTNNSSTIKPTVNNSVNLVVDSGINGIAYNRSYITLTICQVGTSNCQTIDHIVVDSGSTGLRINQSAIALNGITPLNYNGFPIYQCMQYAAGYAFGPVVNLDLRIAEESAFNIPVQIFEYNNPEMVPNSCSYGMPPANLAIGFGANGIIGINPISNPDNDYTPGGVYTCDGATCTEVSNPNSIPQILNINPIAAFVNDNNGVIFSLPKVESVATMESQFGTLTFGLNTQDNNQVSNSVSKLLGSPNTDIWPVGFFIANVGSQNTVAMFDSGTPTYAMDVPIALCPSPYENFYCPASGDYNVISMLSGVNGGSSTPFVSTVFNYTSFGGFATVMPYIGQSIVSIPSVANTLYGLPAFFGKSIYLGFKGAESTGAITPLGQGPAWGFSEN